MSFKQPAQRNLSFASYDVVSRSRSNQRTQDFQETTEGGLISSVHMKGLVAWEKVRGTKVSKLLRARP